MRKLKKIAIVNSCIVVRLFATSVNVMSHMISVIEFLIKKSDSKIGSM